MPALARPAVSRCPAVAPPVAACMGVLTIHILLHCTGARGAQACTAPPSTCFRTARQFQCVAVPLGSAVGHVPCAAPANCGHEFASAMHIHTYGSQRAHRRAQRRALAPPCPFQLGLSFSWQLQACAVLRCRLSCLLPTAVQSDVRCCIDVARADSAQLPCAAAGQAA